MENPRSVSELLRFDTVMIKHRPLLLAYCHTVAERYNVDNLGRDRIIYNHLYPLLYRTLDADVRLGFYEAFLEVVDDESISELFDE